MMNSNNDKGNKNFTLPDCVLTVLDILRKAGFSAYIVGGCVRDLLMGKSPHDWDITTNALPAQTQAVFESAGYAVILTGVQHGTVTVVFPWENQYIPFEITAYRVDGAYSDSRRPDTVAFTNMLTLDLARRDFTMNAMAYHPRDGLCDPFGGECDIAAKKIRCVGIPVHRFEEDALRILRAVRFSAVLGFTLDNDTKSAVLDKKQKLCKVSAERIYAELEKLICGAYADKAIREYFEVLTEIIPAFDKIDKKDIPRLDCLPPVIHIRLAALLSKLDDSTNPNTDMVKDILLRLKCSKFIQQRVAMLARYAKLPPVCKKSAVKRLLNKLTPEGFFELTELWENGCAIRQTAQKIISDGEAYAVCQLKITGDTLLSLGVPPGKMIGVLLNHVLDMVIEEKLKNEHHELVGYILTLTALP